MDAGLLRAANGEHIHQHRDGPSCGHGGAVLRCICEVPQDCAGLLLRVWIAAADHLEQCRYTCKSNGTSRTRWLMF